MTKSELLSLECEEQAGEEVLREVSASWRSEIEQSNRNRLRQIEAMLNTATASRSDPVRTALKWCSTSCGSMYLLDWNDVNLSLARFKYNVQETSATYWMCVGLLWRHLQDFPTKSAGSRLPRKFLSLRASSVPLLRAGIEIAEKELHSPNPQYAPADVAFYLVTGIEPLVRSLSGNEDGGVRGILDGWQNQKDDAESKKFGWIARGLYESYRTDAVHKGHTLHLHVNSWSEAMSIYSAVRMLLELHDRIKARTKPN